MLVELLSHKISLKDKRGWIFNRSFIQYVICLVVCCILVMALLSISGRTLAQAQPELTSLSLALVVNDSSYPLALSGSGFSETTQVAVGGEMLSDVTLVRLQEAFVNFSLVIDPFGAHDLWAGQRQAGYGSVKGIVKAAISDLSAWHQIDELSSTGSCDPMQVVFDPQRSGTLFVSAHTSGFKNTDGRLSWQGGLAEMFLRQISFTGEHHRRRLT